MVSTINSDYFPK